jgi:putative inorganic carbon (HCO3(-)) transporter
MDAVKSSFFYSLLLPLLNKISYYWQRSAVNAFLTGIFVPGVKASGTYRFLTKEDRVYFLWKQSLFHTIFDFLINLIPRLLSGLYKLIAKPLSVSLTGYILDWLADKSYVIFGLFLTAMLCIPYDVWSNSYGLIGAGAVFALYYLWAAPRRLSSLIKISELGPLYFIFLIVVVISFFFSEHPGLSLRFILFHFTSVLIVLYMLSIKDLKQLKTILYFVAVGLFIASCYGCYQIATGVKYLAYQLDAVLNPGIKGRIYSFFDNPNDYASYYVMLLPFVFALLITAKKLLAKAFCLLTIGISIVAVGATYSRGCWLALILAIFIFALLVNWRSVFVLILLGLAAVPLLPDTIVTRLSTIGNKDDTSFKYRLNIFESFLRLLKDYWKTGVGLGTDVTFKLLHDYPPMPDGHFALHSHNNYLQMCSEIGIIGTFSYVAVLLHKLRCAAAAVQAGINRDLKIVLSAAVGAMCGIMVAGLMDYTWYYPRTMFYFWFLFGVLALCLKLARQAEQE